MVDIGKNHIVRGADKLAEENVNEIYWHGCCLQRDVLETRNVQQLKTISIMTIKPLADRVLVRPAEAEQKTASGIIIPDTAKEKPQRGEVLAVGKGTKDHEMTVKVGAQVLYGKYSGTEIEIDGEKLMIMKESDIYAII